MSDYFTLFNLKKKFDINIDELTTNFYKLQHSFHPDLFINSSLSVKEKKLMQSININKGYKILSNSLSRAEYLLSLQQNFSNKNRKELLSVKSYVLKQQFYWYTELEKIKEKKNNEVMFKKFFLLVNNQIIQYEQSIAKNFRIGDFKKILNLIVKLRFIIKFRSYLLKMKNSIL